MSVIASEAVKGRMLKIKFGELLALAGGIEAAAGFCRVGKSSLARYASLSDADADFFAPIDVVHEPSLLYGIKPSPHHPAELSCAAARIGERHIIGGSEPIVAPPPVVLHAQDPRTRAAGSHNQA